ncbi:MAG: cyclic pyranopterin monophosphate synthase MoaC [Alphaproteobacteria bacterium]|jgi:cyclic pyranopterin phosphate synthase|nr:cyclic pyranopterin monophosphate synthase MoaC [Alphaproteobacteria bacterium]
MSSFTHFDEQGRARMVDVSQKAVSERSATAKASVLMQPETLQLIRSGGMKKGDVLQVARLAGIMAAKRTSDLIPLCHPLGLDAVEVDLVCDAERNAVDISATCRIKSRTGVEMEALTAASVAALTVYDMCKAVDRAMRITDLRLTHKAGGKSGEFFQD